MAKSTHQSKHHFGIIEILTILNSLIIILVFFMLINIKQKAKTMQSSMPQVTSVSYNCADDKTIQSVFFEDKAELNLSDGRSFLLMQGISGSGVRYTDSDESITFWTKGTTAFLEEEGTETYSDCTEEDN